MTFRSASLDRIPPEIAAVRDYEAFARSRLDDNAWAYLTGGGADGITMRWNREAFDACRLSGRVLVPVEGGNTHIELLGTTLAHPILLAPVAYQKLFHADGEKATAMAASAMDTLAVVSTLSSTSLEDVAAAGEGSPQWFQLYMQPDRGLTRSLVERAETAKYRAIVVTVDAPVNGVRNAEQRVGFRLPAHVHAANLMNMSAPSAAAMHPDAHPVFDVALAGAPTWKDVDWLIASTRLPVLLKGILSPRDAVEAAERGVAGVIVSNHGGRTLDTLEPTFDVLPRVADAVGDRLPLLIDGGIQRGTDVLKALALGARAVLVGKAYAMALAAAGPLGVAHVIRVLTEEFAVAMALTGCRDVSQIGPDIVTGGRRPPR